MRTTLIIIAILFFAPQSKSQVSWCEEGATWYYSYVAMMATGYQKMEYIGDTTYLGQQCQMLQTQSFEYYFFNDTYYTSGFDTLYTYVENDSVYYANFDFNYSSGDQFELLIDFNATIGDSWILGPEPQICEGFIASDLVELDTTRTINGYVLKSLHVLPAENAAVNHYGEIVERIGPIEDYMFPQYYGCIAVEQGYYFRCYFDDEFGWYHPDEDTPCDYITTEISENSQNLVLRTYPNPASHYIQLSGINTEKTFNYVIYNSEGMIAESGIQSELIIPIGHLPTGIYILRIENEDGWHNARFVKR